MEKERTQDDQKILDKPLPLWFMIILPFYAGGILAVFLFPAAGDWSWLEGWILIITFAINMGISMAVINKVNPRVLRNRMKVKKIGLTESTRKSAGSDRFLTPIMGLGFFSALIFPGLAHRWGWFSISFPIEIIGIILMNLGLIIMNTAMLQNPFASKLLDINKEQYLVDTGLYASVRHPLYAGAILMILAIPVGLGSWWALIPAVFASLTLVVRIEFEEDMLISGMDGYQDYQVRVKYRLIPKIY
jgi:protein-S-isoprenylcysteine O-methyltransferase Ste14